MRSGWPHDWAERKAAKDCSLCEPLGPPADDIAAVLRLPQTSAWLEWRSRLPGYCVVAWRGRHVAEIFELAPDEQAAYWADVALVARAIDAAFHPMKINLMTLGNWGPHLHTHVVPRYLNDPAPGNPISYSDMLTEDPYPRRLFGAGPPFCARIFENFRNGRAGSAWCDLVLDPRAGSSWLPPIRSRRPGAVRAARRGRRQQVPRAALHHGRAGGRRW